MCEERDDTSGFGTSKLFVNCNRISKYAQWNHVYSKKTHSLFHLPTTLIIQCGAIIDRYEPAILDKIFLQQYVITHCYLMKGSFCLCTRSQHKLSKRSKRIRVKH